MMREEDREKIIEILGQMQCPRDFRCAESGFECLCSAKDFGLESYLECLERDPWSCKFALSFGGAYLCRCPLRVYLAKELGK
jgi:hypothetical protein